MTLCELERLRGIREAGRTAAGVLGHMATSAHGDLWLSMY